MEAGNRCFDKEVPEETNRRIIDSCSDILLPYTRHSRDYLIREGYHPKNIIVTGNPIHEVLNYYRPLIEERTPFETLEVEPHDYFLVTLHRSENVDHKERLQEIMKAFETLAVEHDKTVLISVHPRLKKYLENFNILPESKKIKLVKPLGFLDFVRLQQKAYCVLSDSGTVPEECSILNVPCVLLRTSTERPELLETGSFILGGRNLETICQSVSAVLRNNDCDIMPHDYLSKTVSRTITHVMTGCL